MKAASRGVLIIILITVEGEERLVTPRICGLHTYEAQHLSCWKERRDEADVKVEKGHFNSKQRLLHNNQTRCMKKNAELISHLLYTIVYMADADFSDHPLRLSRFL